MLPANDDLQALDTQDQLVIAAGAEWFKLPGQPMVVLETRIPLRRLLLALGELKMRTPNAVLPVTAAFEAGWPGERATPTAAAMRVYTAVHTLRRMGLKGLLIRRRRGYVLDCAVQIAASESQFPPAMPQDDDSLELLAAPIAQSA
ncbi:MAG: hypothetical protein KIT84_25420 [Labilithrix sp.]|nr:hypothetical protein [Labilithrix sp.]MCW5814392.1 hypothetical protein [Labilithrix sp.]